MTIKRKRKAATNIEAVEQFIDQVPDAVQSKQGVKKGNK